MLLRTSLVENENCSSRVNKNCKKNHKCAKRTRDFFAIFNSQVMSNFHFPRVRCAATILYDFTIINNQICQQRKQNHNFKQFLHFLASMAVVEQKVTWILTVKGEVPFFDSMEFNGRSFIWRKISYLEISIATTRDEQFP